MNQDYYISPPSQNNNNIIFWNFELLDCNSPPIILMEDMIILILDNVDTIINAYY